MEEVTCENCIHNVVCFLWFNTSGTLTAHRVAWFCKWGETAESIAYSVQQRAKAQPEQPKAPY